MEPSERQIELVSATAFILVACVFAQLAIGEGVDGRLVAGFAIAYALADRVRLYHGAGFGAPTQIVLVPMLYALPPGLVPATIGAALVAGTLVDIALRREGCTSDCSRASATHGTSRSARLHVFMAADPGGSGVRGRSACSRSPSWHSASAT